eukprot:5359770-Heterocapsa_arctica.AAC.1
MVVADMSEVGFDMWFRSAVEMGRFFKGGPMDDLTACTKKTVDIITMFIDPAHQTVGQTWMANCLSGPFQRAIKAYNDFLVANELNHSRVAGDSGASDSTAVVPAVVDR